MRMDKFSYAMAEGCLYEGMRWKNTKGKIEPEREGKALIDVDRTSWNETYVKECLLPNHRFKDSEYKKAHRGDAIADYHNSQTSSQSRAIMNGEKKSQAIGCIITLPRDNPWVQQANLTDEEYEYMMTHLIETPHDTSIHLKVDEDLERSIKEKLTTFNPTKEEREKVTKFLLACKDAWLDVAGIRKEDVLFWCVHWDESFPHIHVMALPTCEKTYDKDIYSNRVKKDGTRTLLHKKGEKNVTYSVSRYYENQFIDKDGKRHVPFMEEYHEKVIEKMQKNPYLTEEAKEVATHLLNGATKGCGFIPADHNREQREQQVLDAGIIRILKQEKASLQSDKEKLEVELAKANRKLNTALDNAEQAEALVDSLEQEKRKLYNEVMSLRNTIRELFANLKTTIKEVVKTTVKAFLPAWAKATTEEKRRGVTQEAKASIEETLLQPITRVEETIESVLNDTIRREANLSSFEKTQQRFGFAINQIKKASIGTRYEEALEYVTKENAMSNSLMRICLEDWFNTEKYKPILETMSEEDEVEYLKSQNRASRALQALDMMVDSGVVELDDNDLDR